MAENTNATPRVPRVVEAQASVTRPNDTTQYVAGDAISDNATTATAAGAFTFDLKVQTGGSARITDITIHKSDHDVTAATFWLLLFDALPAVAGWEDNAQCDITDAEMKNCKATISIPAAGWINAVTGDVQTVVLTNPVGVVCATGSSTLYGILLAGGTYTPAAQEVFTITLHAVQD